MDESSLSVSENPLNFRPAYADERARAESLCTPSPAQLGEGPIQCFVAVKEHPVERLVGAAFWRVICQQPHETLVEFEWNLVAGLAGGDNEHAFLSALCQYTAASLPKPTRLQTSSWFPVHSSPATLLMGAGWMLEESIMYVGNVAEWTATLETSRFRQVSDPDKPAIRPTEPNQHDALKSLLCDKPALLRDGELAHGFRTAWSQSPSLFDPRCSWVEWRDNQPVATCLAQVDQTRFNLVALAAENAAQADHLLLHVFRSAATLSAVRQLQFQVHKAETTVGSAMAQLTERFPTEQQTKMLRFHVLLGGKQSTSTGRGPW